MNNKTILVSLSLTFWVLHSAQAAESDFTWRTAIKKEDLKKFSTSVWQEMQQQPDSFVAGVGLGTILNASNVHISRSSRVPHLVTGAGIYWLYSTQPKVQHTQKDAVIYTTAQAANIVAGCTCGYLVLSLLNHLSKS